jgi:DNA polymerase-3 subunit alpha
MSKANKKVMEALISCGAMDCFSRNRAALQAHLPYALKAADQAQKNQDAGMVDLFAMDTPADEIKPLPHVTPWDEKKRLMNEKEALGLFLTGHPIDLYEQELKQIVSVNLGQWLEKLDTTDSPNSGFRRKEEEVTVAGLVIGIRTRNSFNGREVFVTLDDRTGRIDVRVFPEMFQEIEEIVKKDVMWVVEGGISYDDFNNGIRIRAKKVELLETFRMNHANSVHINCADTKLESINELARKLQKFRQQGRAQMVFHGHKDGYDYLLCNDRGDLALNDECILTLEQQLGKTAFRIDYS